MAQGNEFIKWIKERIEAFKPQPPESVWNNISNELDIDDVWQGINNELNIENRIYRYDQLSYIPAAAAMILLLLLPFGNPGFLIHDRPRQEIITQTQEQESPAHNQNSTREKESNILNNEQKPQGETNNPIAANNQKDQSIASESIEPDLQSAPESKIVEKPAIQMKEIKSNELQALKTGSNELQIKPIKHESIKTMDDEAPPQNNFKPRLVAFGFAGAIKNQWLLSPSTMRGLEGKNYTSIAPDYGKNIGVFGSFRLNKNLKIQGEGNFISEMGQKYFEYKNGQYISREMDLKYYTLDVILKINTPDFLKKLGPEHSDFLAGFYSGYLNKAKQNLNGIANNSNRDFKDYDFGIVAGYEFTVNPNNPVELKPSIRINYGLTNIYAGSEIIPAHFRKTKTASISLNLAFSFSNL